MNEELELYMDDAKERMEKAIEHLERELLKIRAGKASPNMLDSVRVDNFGTESPIKHVANVNTTDARTLVVQPWQADMLPKIERAIINSNIGLTPNNNGEKIIINVPPLTEERRKALVKQVKNESENAKVSIRSVRKDTNNEIKNLQKDGLSEDAAKSAEEEVQKMTDEYSEKVDKLVEKKEQDIMTV